VTVAAYGIAFPASRGVLAPAARLLARLSASPTGAYATWVLSSTYAGALLRVRRSSDNTEQDIGRAGGFLDVAALLAFVGAGNGFVTKWYDQSGHAHDFSQATAANQPQIVSGGALITDLNGLPSPQFNGTSQYLGGPPQEQVFTNAGWSSFGLARPLAGGANASQPYTGPQVLGDIGWIFNGYGGPSVFTGGYWASIFNGVTIPVSFPSTHISCLTYAAPGTVKGWIDGGAATSANTSVNPFTVHTGAAMKIGATQTGLLSGNICAVLAFDTAAGLADINSIGQDWAAKAGLSWTTAT